MIYFGIALFSFLTTYLIVPLNCKLSTKLGIIDYPRKRSIHKIATPKSGGISLLIGLFLTQFILLVLKKHPSSHLFWGLIIGGILIFILGILDDYFDIHAWIKVIIEIIIVLIIISFGFKINLITNPFGDSISVGVFSIPITVIWFLLVMNAINLIDGLDGLAIGIVAIILLILGFASIVCSKTFVAYFAFSISGSCLAFLKYNFYPAKIFLGDAGSLYLGFNIAALSVAGNTQFKGTTAMTMLIPIIVLSLPLIDTFLAIFRRLKTPNSLFQADKNHLHHKMLELGLSYKTVVLIWYFLTGLFGLISMGFLLVDKKILFSLLLILGIMIFIIFYNIIKKEFLK
ncbi:MAG: undecaprenyl/decaprenyl-phosphate alpha-N-acetylglucosaminyl 1-phosphate transferase [Candidatus Cloacimonetes bacterium]|nr:undecaprenyl/decaprenyl-phosphate alpha-N-acetylglucosaminyl 1-phosphate transferase [Candidatus Cloacimonadota bacterium]MBL7086610.1 undecaprenyl/decaprenyl-phosphate alpha-N-acetylglucosaminyl 1-phosphate transferase [Candidatus Cloacimonadota bacterium]